MATVYIGGRALPAETPGNPISDGTVAGLVLAQTSPDTGGKGGIAGTQQGRSDDGLSGYSDDNRGVAKRFDYVNDRDTGRLTDVLAGALRTCGPDWLDARYRIDCLRYYFWEISRELPKTGEYEPVRRVLAKAAADLERIVRRDQEPGAPSLRPRLQGQPVAPRLPPIRPIRPDAVANAEREALAVIDEATTMLLRSTENSDRRKVHFQQIAAAINSTKVLLRST